MKTIYVLLAMAIFFGTTNTYADTFDVSLTTAGSTDILVQTPILNGFQFAYENLTIGATIGLPPTASVSDSTFLATYVVTAGVGVLNVTDVCAKVDVLTPLAPCQAFAFSFTNLSLLDASVVSADIGTNVLVNANVANFDLAGASIALGGGEVDFTNPTPPTSPVPEPSSIALVGTGLMGTTEMVRRRLRS